MSKIKMYPEPDGTYDVEIKYLGPSREEYAKVILVLSQEEAQTLAAYVRLHKSPGALMQSIRRKLEAEIEAAADADITQS